jgi:hypothetical protein
VEGCYATDRTNDGFNLRPETGPIRHSSLPEALLVQIRLIHAGLLDAKPMDLDEMITNFQRDVDPASEASVWEHIACAYLIAALPSPSATVWRALR